ncbi:MAG TPA: class I adenylate-forming enzyme family protein [Polyangiaceae bacterium]|nr:class I adenylate-forming enzyme family protein [Polyangiaceae bacterium]
MIRDSRSDEFLIDNRLRVHAARKPDHVALRIGERSFSYAQLNEAADSWAKLLRGLGVARGDRVLIALDNVYETVLGFYGALRADAVPSIVGAGRRFKRLERIIALAEPRVLLTNSKVAQGLGLGVTRSCRVVLVDDVELEGAISLAAAMRECGSEAAPPARQSIELDLATLCWTTGSTGEPKGVMLTYQNLRNSASAIASYLEHGDDDVVMCVLPLLHTYGLFQLLVTHFTGGTLVLEAGFSLAVPILKRLQEMRVTGFAGVPTIYASILALKDLDRFDLSRLRYLTNAGYALPAAHLRRLQELCPETRIYAMYGQTECTRVCYLPPEQALERPASVGISMPNQELWLVREDGTRAEKGEIGELVVRGPNVMRGYWRDPEGTARALRPGRLPGEVVLYTGDLFRTDEEGYLYFVARADDIIKTRGEKVVPCDVEQAISSLSDVVEVAVLGIPDPIHGVAVKAVVVKRPGSSLTTDDVKRVVFTSIDEVAVPRVVEFVEALPRSEGGKVMKSSLL